MDEFLAGIPPPAMAGAPLVVETLLMAEGLGGPKHRSLALYTGTGWAEWAEMVRKEAKVVKPSSFSQFNQLENEEQIRFWLSVGHCSSCIYSQHGRTPVVTGAVGKRRRKGRCCWHLHLSRL